MVAPDVGSMKRTKKYCEMLGAEKIVVVFKNRDLDTNATDSYGMIGDAKNCDAVIADDEISTGSTMLGAAKMLKEEGAKRVIAAATHGKFVRDKEGKTLADRLSEPDCPIDRLIVTDTIEIPDHIRANEKIDVVSVAPVLAVAMMCWLTDKSLSKRLIR
jgi:ribose-phosphate pyrophosphokinase